jgi:FMN phosphatase YigB (HAD superfamily)
MKENRISMRAIIFDIDGTLLHSNKLDDETYALVIREVLGPVKIRNSWSQYKNISGSGTLLEILEDNGIGNTAAALRAVDDAFVARISKHIEEHGPIPEVPGAKDFVSRLAESGDFQIAYATSGWFGSARIKLNSSRFPLDGIPLASCNDHISKVAIMTHAFDQLTPPFESITYYGDGEWDRTAADTLGWTFVPVGEKLNGIRQYV